MRRRALRRPGRRAGERLHRREDPTKREQMTEQYLPMRIHVGVQAPPIDLVVLPENQVDDVGTVMTIALLNEGFGPDQFGRTDHGHAMAEHLRLPSAVEPLLLDRNGAVAG